MKWSRVLTVVAAVGSCTAAKSYRYDRKNIRKYDKVSPSLDEVQKQAAVAKTNQWTSSVPGKAFDRFVVIWLENTDFDKAAGQQDMQWLAQHGITLTNYWALTHPSQPNYLASVGGDYFALDDDRFIQVPENVSSIVDLLDTKQITWAEYQEDQPYTGFLGYNFSNQETYASAYVRKHNPLVLFDSVTSNEDRLANIKNFTEFYRDLKDKSLPQYMIITPNMTNDGHDTNIKVAGEWSRSFLEPLLKDEYFMNNTLVLLTFDENDTYPTKNVVFSILLGGAVPEKLRGTEDHTYYDHYSQLSSVEANWDLPSLGRHDATANVFEPLAKIASIRNDEVETTYKFNNYTYLGYFNDRSISFPAPNITLINKNGKGVLESIREKWEKEYYNQVERNYFTSTTTTITPGSSPTVVVDRPASDSPVTESGSSSIRPTGTVAQDEKGTLTNPSPSVTFTGHAPALVAPIDKLVLLALLGYFLN
ncbi:ADR238Cp [Eremothecium gossypii ATCC 10895]|uniref:ADR238Cp n=1 Tax=Eremothecium gossypii (strain ATCC 10895 / CBS 109.51 / FGSC 9923 / NRRL Y-1056) TaxID=284811 RepID=Q759N7_EREGS|nr:ADR238Cp [Eremothecium gossypii ATCC 10895]AAS52158.1 ADR238Cp [Eremothecium gossypii ATCC 10895]AEY96457.1 FADR238Cp [Eremothecium gossypii FDAG1]